MAIRASKPTDPNAPKAPPRAQMDAIIRRYIKPGVTPNWRADMPIAYGLWKAYPSLAFWTHHELPFPLNSMAWFLTEQGKAQLAADWTVFHYVPPAAETPPVSTPTPALDTPSQPLYHVPQSRPRSVADFLKTP